MYKTEFSVKKLHDSAFFHLFLNELGINASQFTLSCFYTNAFNIWDVKDIC